jgi:hypothetical protein
MDDTKLNEMQSQQIEELNQCIHSLQTDFLLFKDHQENEMKTLKESLAPAVEAMVALKGLYWIGKFIKWSAGIIAAVLTLWFTFKGHA